MWKPKSKQANINPNVSMPLEIVLFIVDSGCSKHKTGNLKLLINFVEKFLGTVKFGNDQIAPILGYGDLVQGALVEIILFIVNSGCSKHMTGNLKLLIHFVEKFGNQIVPIFGYGDLVQGAVTIKRVYYIEGFNHNLFSIGQFCIYIILEILPEHPSDTQVKENPKKDKIRQKREA
nr:hypothetical protein [Tanacetum cinerariifolium]